MFPEKVFIRRWVPKAGDVPGHWSHCKRGHKWEKMGHCDACRKKRDAERHARADVKLQRKIVKRNERWDVSKDVKTFSLGGGFELDLLRASARIRCEEGSLVLPAVQAFMLLNVLREEFARKSPSKMPQGIPRGEKRG